MGADEMRCANECECECVTVTASEAGATRRTDRAGRDRGRWDEDCVTPGFDR